MTRLYNLCGTNIAQPPHTFILTNRAMQEFSMSSTSQLPVGPVGRTPSTFYVSPNPIMAVAQVGYDDGTSPRSRQEAAGRPSHHPGGLLQHGQEHTLNEETRNHASYTAPNSSMSGTPEVDHELAGLDALEDGRPGERPAYPFTTLIR